MLATTVVITVVSLINFSVTVAVVMLLPSANGKTVLLFATVLFPNGCSGFLAAAFVSGGMLLEIASPPSTFLSSSTCAGRMDLASLALLMLLLLSASSLAASATGAEASALRLAMTVAMVVAVESSETDGPA